MLGTRFRAAEGKRQVHTCPDSAKKSLQSHRNGKVRLQNHKITHIKDSQAASRIIYLTKPRIPKLAPYPTQSPQEGDLSIKSA